MIYLDMFIFKIFLSLQELNPQKLPDAMKKAKLNIEKLEMAASKLRAIAHPMRIAIIDLLTANQKLTVTQIYERLSLEQASASHHLNILKNAGLLKWRKEGVWTHYRLSKMKILGSVDELLTTRQ